MATRLAATCATARASPRAFSVLRRKGRGSRRRTLRCEAKPYVAEALNDASNAALSTMIANDERGAKELASELADLQRYLVNEEKDEDSAKFVRVVQGMLGHRLTQEAEQLDGEHRHATERLLKQCLESEWKLTQEGEAEAEDPQFKTWEDVFRERSERERSKYEKQEETPIRPSEADYYKLLNVSPDATTRDIKKAFRTLALKHHPDVSEEDDAEKRFVQIAAAYDVLSNEDSRKLYDRYGAEGMKGRGGAEAGRGNAVDMWDEFKRSESKSRKRSARASCNGPPSTDKEVNGIAEVGNIVEYPLPQNVKDDLSDGREYGLGLLVGRNMDRADKEKLSDEKLDLCEIESLRQEEQGSNVWVVDELSPPIFVSIRDLKVVPIDSFDRRYDTWLITADLSPDCGGPTLEQEIIV